MTAAATRVVTRYATELMPRVSRASISSLMRIAPNCAVNRQPAWVANANPIITGASSRVPTNEEISPVAGPSPSRFKALNPSTLISAPAVAPNTIATPMVPPPTTIEPLPQLISTSTRVNSFR